MNPIPFKETNMLVEVAIPAAQKPFFPTSYYSDGTNSVYCYKPTVLERLSILFFGKVWLTMRLGRDVAPPMMLAGKKTVFDQPQPSPTTPMVAKTGCRKCHGTGTTGKLAGKDILCTCLRHKEDVQSQGGKVIPLNSMQGGN